MKKKDLQIIASLRKDSRVMLTKLSKRLKIPVSTIFTRIKRNEDGLILRKTILLDFNRLGFNTRAYVFFAIGKKQKKEFIELMMKRDNVNSLYKVNNGFDCMAELIFKNLKEMEDFMDYLENNYVIKRKEVHYIIEDLKREKFMSDPERIELV